MKNSVFTICCLAAALNVSAEELHDYKLVFIPKAKAPVTIDGRVDDGEWGAAAKIADFGGCIYCYNQDLHMPPTEARLMWDDNYLYIACVCREDTPENMLKFKVDISDQSGLVCNHDTFEFHINGPNPGELPKFQIFLVPMPAKEIQHSYDNGWGREVDVEYGRKAEWEKAHFIGDDFWSVEARIALKSLELKGAVGTRVGLNVARLRFNKNFVTESDRSPTSVRHVQSVCWANRKESQHSTRHGRGILVETPPANVVEGLRLSYPDLDRRTVLVQTDRAYVVVENGKTSELCYLDKARSVAEETLAAYSRLYELTNSVPEPKKGLYAQCFAQAFKDREYVERKRAEYAKADACEVGELSAFEEKAKACRDAIENAYYAALRRLILVEGRVRRPVKLVADPKAPGLAKFFEGVKPHPNDRPNDAVRWMKPAAAGHRRALVVVEHGDTYAAWELMHRLDLDADVFIANDNFHFKLGAMKSGFEWAYTEKEKRAMLETTLAENVYDAYIFIGTPVSLLPVRLQCAIAERLLGGARLLSVNGDAWGYDLVEDRTLLAGIPAMERAAAVPGKPLETEPAACEFPPLRRVQVGKGVFTLWNPGKGGTYTAYTSLLPGWTFTPADLFNDEYCYAAAARVAADALGMRTGPRVAAVLPRAARAGAPATVDAVVEGDVAAGTKAVLVLRCRDGAPASPASSVSLSAGSGRRHVTFETAALGAGRHFADVFLVDGDAKGYDGRSFPSAKTWDWASASFEVGVADFGPCGCSPECRALRPAPKIAVIAPAREMFEPGEPVAAAVRVADAAPGLSVAAELRDPRGRVIERGNFPVDAAKGAAQVSFPPKRLVENCHFIAASLRDGAGRELDRREQPIYRRVGRRSDYTIFCDGFHQGGYNGLHHLATLEYYGIDCCQDGSPGRLWFGGDPVIRDRMAGAYSEMDGSMASPYFLASLQRRFRKDAAAIAKKNGLFISCGDDSGVPTKFSATTPDWAPAYFDILIGRFREAERKNGAKGYRLIEQWCKDRGIKPLASYYGGFIGKLRPRNCLPTLLSAKLFPGDFDDIAAAVRSTYVQPNGVEHFNRQNGVEISSWAELTPELIKSIRPAPSSEFVEFQFWLRDSRYNGDIAKLNAFWKSGFKDFFEIDEEAMVELKNRRHFGAEIDRRAYFEHLLTGEIAALRRGVDSVDRRIQSFMGCSGYETLVEQGMRGFGSTCPYWLKHRETEMFRFLKQRGGYVGDTLGTYKSPALPRDQREWDVWHSVLTGANMSWFWTPCYALRGDLGVEAGLAGYTLEAYREIKRGPSSLMLRSRRENDGIRILWSSASARMEGIRSENGSSLAIAKVFQECLENAGYQYDYIYECDVEAGALTGGKVRTLILPAARLLPEKTAAAVRAFVEAGGTAVSDFRPADVAPDGSLLEKGLLDDVFAGPGDGPFAVRRIGRGRTTVLNRNPVCFRFAEGTADDTAMNAKLREAVGFDPAIDARWTGGGRVLGSEITRFTRDGAEFVGFEKRPATGEKLPGEATLRFPKKAWTYDVRGGRALGFVDAVALRLKGFDTHFLSRLPYEVKAVRVDAPREVVRGGTLRVAAEVVVSGGRAGTHVLRVDLVPPGGYSPMRRAPVPYRLVDARAGRATCEIAIAWNEPVDSFTLEVTDVATGVAFSRPVAVAAAPSPAEAKPAPAAAQRKDGPAEKENIVVFAAHPDDLEGCLGFAIKAKDRFKIHVVDFTGGERGIRGKSFEETRAIRCAEEESVAQELGATVHWIGQIDGEACATREAVGKARAILRELRPRAVFLHHPVDLHSDHVMCYAAGWSAVMGMKPLPEIYFYEEGGIGETHNFHPQHYIDITDIWPEKVRLMRLWKCQNKDDFLVRFKEPESLFRGAQMVRPVKYAEGYESLIGVPERRGPTVFQEIAAPSPPSVKIGRGDAAKKTARLDG